MKTNPNDPAYPVDGIYAADAFESDNTGLTKREEFAARAMQGFIAASDWRIMGCSAITIEDAAVFSVKVADKLIEVLNREEL